MQFVLILFSDHVLNEKPQIIFSKELDVLNSCKEIIQMTQPQSRSYHPCVPQGLWWPSEESCWPRLIPGRIFLCFEVKVDIFFFLKKKRSYANEYDDVYLWKTCRFHSAVWLSINPWKPPYPVNSHDSHSKYLIPKLILLMRSLCCCLNARDTNLRICVWLPWVDRAVRYL